MLCIKTSCVFPIKLCKLLYVSERKCSFLALAHKRDLSNTVFQTLKKMKSKYILDVGFFWSSIIYLKGGNFFNRDHNQKKKNAWQVMAVLPTCYYAMDYFNVKQLPKPSAIHCSGSKQETSVWVNSLEHIMNLKKTKNYP